MERGTFPCLWGNLARKITGTEIHGADKIRHWLLSISSELYQYLGTQSAPHPEKGTPKEGTSY